MHQISNSANRKNLSKMDASQITMDTKFKISENDRITGSVDWDNKKSLDELIKSGWDFSEKDLIELSKGKIVKDFSPNGRRIIFVHPLN